MRKHTRLAGRCPKRGWWFSHVEALPHCGCSPSGITGLSTKSYCHFSSPTFISCLESPIVVSVDFFLSTPHTAKPLPTSPLDSTISI